VAKRIKSGLKNLRKSARRRVANAATRSRIKTLVRAAGTSRAGPSGAGASDTLIAAQTALDKAAARGIIHPNAAARRKSRLMRRAARGAA
jgi:small subunit ribosomal protein S20